MKKILSLLVISFLGLLLVLFVSKAISAENRCPLTGNTYVFSIEDIDFELSGFDCTFGPGCEAKCDLWCGNFDTGPLYHLRLPFVCTPDGGIILTLDQVKIPCALNSQGNLVCLTSDISGFHCVRLGTKIWCLPEKPGELQFEQE